MIERFGRWTLIGEKKGRKWECKCDCGTVRMVDRFTLQKGMSTSCGCLKLERTKEANTKHGKTAVSRARTYRSWDAMIQRCTNPNNNRYHIYGGRGITVCERWMKFENFYADMGDAPPGKSIDREEVNGNYEPGNCRWATAKEQAQNRRK